MGHFGLGFVKRGRSGSMREESHRVTILNARKTGFGLEGDKGDTLLRRSDSADGREVRTSNARAHDPLLAQIATIPPSADSRDELTYLARVGQAFFWFLGGAAIGRI